MHIPAPLRLLHAKPRLTNLVLHLYQDNDTTHIAYNAATCASIHTTRGRLDVRTVVIVPSACLSLHAFVCSLAIGNGVETSAAAHAFVPTRIMLRSIFNEHKDGLQGRYMLLYLLGRIIPIGLRQVAGPTCACERIVVSVRLLPLL